MQILWENRYKDIPSNELYDLKRTIQYMVKNTQNHDFEKMKDSSDQSFKNLYTFYHAWNIPYWIKRVEEAKKLLESLLGFYIDPI